MSSSLFAGSSAGSTRENAHETLFSKLKPVCVPLLDVVRRPDTPSTRKDTSRLLEELAHKLRDARSDELSPNLANYVLFPLTALFNADKGDVILEKTFIALCRLVSLWRAAGMPDKVAKELWTLAVLKLGGPIGSTATTKGKGKAEMSEETQLAILTMLEALLDGYWSAKVERDRTNADDLDWMDAKDDVGSGQPPSKAVLFHSLSTVLDVASTPTSLVDLQLKALSTLRLLLHFFCDVDVPRDRIPSMGATILPGTLSKLSKIALNVTSQSGRRHANKVSARAVLEMGRLVVDVVGNARTSSLANDEPVLESLESLRLVSADEGSIDGEGASVKAEPSATEPNAQKPAGLVQPDRSWIDYTTGNLEALLRLLFPLMMHDDPTIREAVASTFRLVLTDAGDTMQRHARLSTVIEGLLLLSCDHRDEIRQEARDAARHASPSVASAIQASLLPILEARLASLPRSIRTLSSTSTTSRIVAAALDALPPSTSALLSNIDRIIWPLLAACQFEPASSSMTWASVDSKEWPLLPLRDLKDKTARRDLENAFKALGGWSCRAQKQAELCDLLVGIVHTSSQTNAPPALWILEQVIAGLDESKKSRKAVKAVTKSLIELLQSMSESDDSKREASVSNELQAKAETNSLVSITKGAATLSSLDALSPVIATVDSAPKELLAHCLALKVLAACAKRLADDFQPFLLEATYHVLSASASPFALLTAHGTAALESISYSTSYASSTNLVVANVDYVFNSVSLRLSPSRLDLSAPSVLREMIKLGGAEILPMVEDVVLDILDMIDDYHGYEQLCQELWSVLDVVIGIMPVHAETEPARLVEHRPSAAEEFQRWYEANFGETDAAADEVHEVNPEKPFQAFAPADEEPKEPGFPTAEEGDETKAPPSLAESLCIKILSKSVYFLTHSSASLRVRILRLMAMAVPILSAGPSKNDSLTRGRQGDLLPAIDKAWPYVLLRLQDNTSPPVVLAAVELVARLAKDAGPFMSRRIMDDAWPLFKRISNSTQARDSSVYSAMSKPRNAGGVNQPQTWASKVVHAMCEAVVDVARTVPLKEDVVWDIAVSMRSFASNRVPEVRKAVEKMYVALSANANVDIVWTVLTASVERMEGGEWLSLEKEADKEALRSILHQLH